MNGQRLSAFDLFSKIFRSSLPLKQFRSVPIVTFNKALQNI